MFISIFTEYPQICAGTTTAKFGNTSNLLPTQELKKAHQKLLAITNFNSLIVPSLVHSDSILNADHTISTQQEADAVISQQQNTLIGVTTADCVPVFLFDPTTNSVGIVHSGRKGLALNITNKTILQMIHDFSIDKSSLKVHIGAHICEKCYQVSPEITQEFPSQLISNPHYLPMQKIILDNLLNLGIPQHNISTSNLCTHCTKDEHNQNLFFSYRDNANPNRMISYIGLV